MHLSNLEIKFDETNANKIYNLFRKFVEEDFDLQNEILLEQIGYFKFFLNWKNLIMTIIIPNQDKAIIFKSIFFIYIYIYKENINFEIILICLCDFMLKKNI